jgi:hypothetical protein
MKKLIKIVGVLLAVLVVVAASVYVWARITTSRLRAATIETHSVDFPIPFPIDPAEVASLGLSEDAARQLAQQRAVERGRHLVTARYTCIACHSENFGGGVMVGHANSATPTDPATIATIRPSIAKPDISTISARRPDIQASPSATPYSASIAVAPPVLAAPAVARAIQSADSTSVACASATDPRMNIPTRTGRIAHPNALAVSHNGTPSARPKDAAIAESPSQMKPGPFIAGKPCDFGCLKHSLASSILTAHQSIGPQTDFESTSYPIADTSGKIRRLRPA